jgi:hypothetical protein
VDGGIEHCGQFDHLHGARNDTGFAAKPCKPMSLWPIVALNQMRLRFGLNEQFLRNQICINVPIVAEIDLNIPSLQSFAEL